MRSLRLAIVLTSCLLPTTLQAQSIVLEAEPGVYELAYCETPHIVSGIDTCKHRHVTEVTDSGLQLDGEDYVIEWQGPGYYLENGWVVQPFGETKPALKGQRWLEIYPKEGRIHTSQEWKDLDADKNLGVADTLVLESGRELWIKDVRLHVRVRPARPEAPERPREERPAQQR